MRRVASKLEEGNFKGAVRTVCSEDSIADIDSVETISALQEKHHSMHLDAHIPDLIEDASLSTPISEDDVFHAIRSFPRGSAGGQDRIRPQHLLDLICASAERGGRVLLSALTSFCHHVMGSLTLESARPIFFGATLIPLKKKDGGISPIAFGQTLRRLVTKCLSRRVAVTVGADLVPLQLGCGVPLGCEATAHATRQYLHHMPQDHLLLKLDFRNAFNSLWRDKMLEAVQQYISNLSLFIYSDYASPSHLFCGDHILKSAEGVQQGDPLGPLLFCITIQQLIVDLLEILKLFYLDESILGGSLGDVLTDITN